MLIAYLFFKPFYSINQRLLKATIGSNFAALLAGNTPKINPIDPDNETVKIITLVSILAGRLVVTFIALTVPNPRIVHNIPPKAAKIKDSIKN